MRLIDADVLIKHLCEIMTTANHFGNIERVSEIGACIGVIKGEKTIEQPDGMCRDRLKEVFREASETGGDLFHISQIENIIDGEAWL